MKKKKKKSRGLLTFPNGVTLTGEEAGEALNEVVDNIFKIFTTGLLEKGGEVFRAGAIRIAEDEAAAANERLKHLKEL